MGGNTIKVSSFRLARLALSLIVNPYFTITITSILYCNINSNDYHYNYIIISQYISSDDILSYIISII